MPRFRLRAGTLEAVQYKGKENINDVLYFFEKDQATKRRFVYLDYLQDYAVSVKSESGYRELRPVTYGDYILRTLDGEFKVMHPEMFMKRYEEVEECHLQIDQEE